MQITLAGFTKTIDGDNYQPQGLDLLSDPTANEPADHQCTSPNDDPIKPFTFHMHVITENDNRLYKTSPGYLSPETFTKYPDSFLPDGSNVDEVVMV